MTLSGWRVVDAKQLVPANLVSAVRAAATLTEGVLATTNAAFKVTATVPAIPGIPDASTAAATALLDSLDALIAGTQIHAILIPIAKTLPSPAASRSPATLEDLQAWLDVRLGPAQGTSEAYQSLVTGSAGNAGFYRTFLASLFDDKDPNRPQFIRQSDAVTMAVIVAGASSYASVEHAASLFDQLFRPRGTAGDAGARVVPVPQNVTARPVSASSGSRIAIKIGWDPPPSTILPPYFPGLAVSIRRYAVIRLTGPRASGIRGVLDLFATQDLVEGMTTRDATVVGIGSGTNASFLDPDPPVDPDNGLHYCVAWETQVREPSGDVVMKFDRVSGVCKVDGTAPPPPQTGNPPDWMAANAAVDVFPDLASAARKVLARAGALIDGRPSPTTRLSNALGAAMSMANRLSSRAEDLMDDVDRLQASLSRPLPALHAVQITGGSGGNAFLAAELARRLGDLSDPGRPPFDHGEYVCGVCIVAGAPRLADLAGTIAFFGSLLGPSDPTNPLLSVLVAIDTAVTQAETVVFGPDVRPLPRGTDLSAIDPLTGRPVAPAASVISDAGKPVAGSDPGNPNQGDINVIPLTELC